MPADDTFDAVHPLTVAADRYGCFDRKEFADGYWAPDGYRLKFGPIRRSGQVAEPMMRWVSNTMSRDCVHVQSGGAHGDGRCAGCRWLDQEKAEWTPKPKP